MRRLIALALLHLPLMGVGWTDREIVFAYPDAGPAQAVYRWGRDNVTSGIPLSAAIHKAQANGGSHPMEIRLLHRDGAAETLYRLDLGSTQRALRWRGAADRQLVLRGQIDRSGQRPLPRTVVVGRSLKETICFVTDIDLCALPEVDAPASRDVDALDYLAGEMNRRSIIKGDGAATEDVKLRLHCMVAWDSEFVEVQDVGFRDCWLAAFATYRSSHVALRNSIIEGSTYALAAVGGEATAATAHSFEITGNLWKQSPSAYIARASSCDIQSDWNCPVSIWHQVPWAITHHFFWSPLNGALFASKDIAGNVKISGNHVIDAYNGVRSRLNKTCLADPACRTRANVGFEITDNIFERIRDNPIEPEGHAAYWIVKHNTFVDVHAAISTDGVSGHDLLVFGNVFVLRARAGAECAEGAWLGSRSFRPSLGGGGRWSAERADGDEARCSTHSLGTIIKLGGGNDPEAPLLDRILFFNNSLQTRSPLFRASPAPPITSYNNAVQFTGCGKDDPRPCRQDPEPDPSCTGEEFWTTDRQALVVDCFPLRDLKGKPIPHRMRHNAYNRAPDGKLNSVEADRVTAPVEFPETGIGQPVNRAAVEAIFAVPENSSLAKAGCALRYADGDVECTGNPGPVGALLPDGRRFDLALPFSFPFRGLVKEAEK
jgi:hypothetical protein